MFSKVLVANRGEIAARIMRTAKEMGIATVAVYHHLDRGAPHVRMADEAVELDGDVPTKAYLDQEQIIGICARLGAEAIHPGYGFLSENAEFAERVTKAGIVFVGPDAGAMHLMGDKVRSRNFAAEHGVPVAPSVLQGDDPENFLARAKAIGFPLLIKASAGGGGKGMKIVREAADLVEAVRTASSEAERYFGDGLVYAEKLVERGRHIEVQVIGDGTGRVLHLCERECSIQRRYQKIVEEAPAPNLSDDLCHRIRAAAVQLASAAKYRNAGTIEFILGADREFYFLEMNTRLQVEHPVTEMILGLDLVAEQFRVAAGEGLSFRQEDIKPSGHAIEVRICAEEPEKDFRPAIGRVGLLRLPAGEQVRFDGGIAEGQAVTPAFDSMLAKLIVHSGTRAEAIARMKAALADLALLGVPTNIDYLARVMAHPAFAAARIDTGFLSEHAGTLNPDDAVAELERAACAAAALAQSDFRRLAFDVPEPHAAMGGWRN